GNFLVIIGNNQITTNIYDPISNVFYAGPSLGGGAGDGAMALQRPDGKIVIVRGGTSQFTDIYDPITNSMTPGPTLPTNTTVDQGSHSIRRQDGRYMISTSTTATAIYD